MSIPTSAIWNSKRIRVVDYVGLDRWLILDTRDQYRVVQTGALTFTK